MKAPGPLLDCLDYAPGELGVAVSGGGDSVALLILLHERAKETGTALHAVTVDHNLRNESADEAAGVARLCAELDVDHTILRWENRPKSGNLQATARKARYALIREWANERGVRSVALGHTSDDQAETFLMRLARGSGVDGLSAMSASVHIDGIWWLRPMLSLQRESLRNWLRDQSISWAEDPGNHDPKYARVRMREAISTFHDLGISASDMIATSVRMARARSALEHYAQDLAARCLVCHPTGDAVLNISVWRESPEETRLRVLAASLGWASGSVYRPRFTALHSLEQSVSEQGIGSGLTLHGCVLRQRENRLLLRREPALVCPPVPVSRGAWDNRWVWESDKPENLRVGALGVVGLEQLADWRDLEVPREVLLTTPAVWEGDMLREAPFAGLPGRVRIVPKTLYPELKLRSLKR